jgi:signal transduction histidine kinase
VTLLKLLRNPEVGKLAVLWLLFTFIFVVIALTLSYVSLQHFKLTTAANQAAIVGVVAQQYPEAEREVIRQIQAADEAAVSRGQAVLSKYGLAPEDMLYDTALLGQNFRMNAILYVSLALLVAVTLVWIFVLFLRKQYRIVREINTYAHGIAEGSYILDLRDNEEGDISLLKNEIYKLTTMLKEQTEALKQDKARLAASIADISHQLKTPLTSLFVLNDLLSDHPPEEVQTEFLNRMRSQLNRMEWLVASLLKLSKFDAGTVHMKNEIYTASELANKVLETLSIPLDVKSQKVTVTGDASIRLFGDIQWTSEALINILKNCIEHTPMGGEIRLTFEDNPIYTRIAIADEGLGIDPADLPYIFNRFYKGKNARNDSVGIGLAMALAIVREQGGDISVHSETGVGTEFAATFFKGNV